jgi:hypothetical protein
MKFLSPVVAASILVILGYAIFFKKAPEQTKTNKMEIGTQSEVPAAPAVKLSMPTEQTDRQSIKKIAAKSKPRSFNFVAQKKKSENVSKQVASVTGMTPATSDYNLVPADKEQALKVQTSKNMINPADSRWISELSGQKAKLKMGVQGTDISCDDDYRLCERTEDKKEVLVGGMVVKAERLVSNPTRSMDGQVARGHYIKRTPAVYVK